MSKAAVDKKIDPLVKEADALSKKLEQLEAELAKAEQRRANPLGTDTRDDLIKLDLVAAGLKADRDIVRRDLKQAEAALTAAEDEAIRDMRRRLGAELLSESTAFVRERDELLSPIAKLVDFSERRRSFVEKLSQFNAGCGDDEEPIVDLFEQDRRSSATPDVATEVQVEVNERTGEFRDGYPLYRRAKRMQQVIEPGRPAVWPTPFHEAFEVPALRAGEPNFRAEGTTRPPYIIDANGAEHS